MNKDLHDQLKQLDELLDVLRDKLDAIEYMDTDVQGV